MSAREVKDQIMPGFSYPAYIELADGSFLSIDKASPDEITAYMEKPGVPGEIVAGLRRYQQRPRPRTSPRDVWVEDPNVMTLPVLEHAFIDVAPGDDAIGEEVVVLLLDLDDEQHLEIVVPEGRVDHLRQLVDDIQAAYDKF